METRASDGAHDVASSTDVLGSIRRHWIVATSIVVVCVLAAVVIAVVQPNRYTATSTVLVDSPADALPTAVNMATEKEIAGSPAVVELAVDALGLETPVDEVLPQIGVDVPVDSSVLQISATADDPDEARRLAGAMGHAYLDFQRQSSLDRLAASTELLDERIDTLTRRLRDLGSADVVDPPDVAANRAEAAAILSQISILEQRIAAAATTDVVPGRIIADAVRPSAASGPPIVASAVFGAVVGLLIATGAIIAIGSFDRRVRTPKEVQVAMRARILGEVAVPRMLETSSNGDGMIFDGHGRAALTFRRLRTNLLVVLEAKSGPGRPAKRAGRKPPRTIAIVAARDEFATSYVAANLGAVLATDGRRVTVVSVSPTSPARLSAMLHVDGASGPAEAPDSAEIRPTSVPNLHIAMATPGIRNGPASWTCRRHPGSSTSPRATPASCWSRPHPSRPGRTERRSSPRPMRRSS